MGKQSRKRTSFHTSPTKINANPSMDVVLNTGVKDVSVDSLNTTPINFVVPDNLFKNVNINFATVKRSLNDDTHSTKSFKSVKSDKTIAEQVLSKKEKLKLRRELLLQKIDALNQKKKEANMRRKRRKLSVIGDTNSLLDALSSMETSVIKENEVSTQKNPKGIQKTAKQKKDALKNIHVYKTISKNKNFLANPLQAITQHIRAVVDDDERMKLQFKKSSKK